MNYNLFQIEQYTPDFNVAVAGYRQQIPAGCFPFYHSVQDIYSGLSPFYYAAAEQQHYLSQAQLNYDNQMAMLQEKDPHDFLVVSGKIHNGQ